MNLSHIFGFTASSTKAEELLGLFPLDVQQTQFVKNDVMNIYSKILTDVAERIDGLSDEQAALLWDNCVMSSSQDGLITMLAKAMYEKKDLFIVYDKALPIVREATSQEKVQIQTAYKGKAEPAKLENGRGVYISFKNFDVTDMVKIYSALEYCTAGSLNKQMNLANSLLVKIKNLRSSVGAADKAVAEAQAKAMATSLQKGQSTLMDAEDMIETGKADIEPAKASSEYIAKKLSFYLGLPAAYIMGEQTGGMNANGEVDQNAVERGLKKFYFSILKPVYEALFEVKPKYKSQNTRQITSGLETMKTFSLVGDEYFTRDQMLRIVRSMFDIDETEEEPDEIDVTPDPDPETPVPTLPRGQA